jgi:hypothetical protein
MYYCSQVVTVLIFVSPCSPEGLYTAFFSARSSACESSDESSEEWGTLSTEVLEALPTDSTNVTQRIWVTHIIVKSVFFVIVEHAIANWKELPIFLLCKAFKLICMISEALCEWSVSHHMKMCVTTTICNVFRMLFMKHWNIGKGKWVVFRILYHLMAHWF